MRVVAVLLVFVAGPLLYQGCSNPKRYHVLSFFFDGVPVPEGMSVTIPEWAKDPTQGPAGEGFPTTAPGDNRAANGEAPKSFIFHKPYMDRNCTACHDMNLGFKPIKANAELCIKCHRSHIDVEADDWVHGPSGLGQCSLCHAAHKSESPGLLAVAQPELCLKCHDAAFIEKDPFHSALTDKTCSNCHDPHASGNRLLLADGRTYQWREKKQGVEIKRGHPMWGKEDCAKCHYTEKSNAMRDNVDQVCLTCHDKIQTADPGTKLHEAVAKGKCIVCHTPHSSRRPHLIRQTAEKICLQCHKLDEVRKPGHPNVTRVDCLICHAGHSAPQPHLLRPNIAGPERGPATQPAVTHAPTATPGDETRGPS
jgi:predicted CXXCH cytochrome family protein